MPAKMAIVPAANETGEHRHVPLVLGRFLRHD
jgi:hypothetical protein